MAEGEWGEEEEEGGVEGAEREEGAANCWAAKGKKTRIWKLKIHAGEEYTFCNFFMGKRRKALNKEGRQGGREQPAVKFWRWSDGGAAAVK